MGGAVLQRHLLSAWELQVEEQAWGLRSWVELGGRALVELAGRVQAPLAERAQGDGLQVV